MTAEPPQRLSASGRPLSARLQRFQKTFAMGEDIDADRIAAHIEHGLLTVHLPLSKPKVKGPRRIPVESPVDTPTALAAAAAERPTASAPPAELAEQASPADPLQ